MLVYFIVLGLSSGIVSANKSQHSNTPCMLNGHKPIVQCLENNNATYKSCPNPCPSTCKKPEGVRHCSKKCQNYGCECNPGYVLSDNGKCILLQDCPAYLRCNGDRNTTYKECPNPCPRTCQFPGGQGVCTEQCVKEGCECKDGYYLDKNGKCVRLQDCSGAKKCSANETFVFCKVGCPTNNCPVDDSLGILACSPPFPCASGCSCKADYLRRGSVADRCILASDCPPVKCTRPNEEWDPCVPPCPFNRCSDIGKPDKCDKPYSYCRPQCTCKKGFYRNDQNICVPEKLCGIKCGYNEVPVECQTVCPPQTCKVSCPEFGCLPELSTCEPGCDCLPDHLRNDSGVCVPMSECPPRPNLPTCGYNEIPSYCKVVCPPQTCESIFSLYNCTNVRNNATNPGCNCLSGYLRNSSGICIPSDRCFLESKCDIPKQCRTTCAKPNPKQKCPSVEPATDNQNGCKCKPGFILNKTDGDCIRVEECPNDIGCNGDSNSVITSCPWPCPATCVSPNAGNCGKKCIQAGCQCKNGYILNRNNGKCILPDKCRGGNPCGVNATFSDCGFRCPNQNCPEDDLGVVVACKPGRPCPPGCLCKEYYKRNKDDICVLASDCPVVKCTKPNEVWDYCASECLEEKCDDINKKKDCVPDPNNCQPKCVCSNGFYKNKTGVCVPKNQCPSQCDVPSKCIPTCAVPNPPNCPSIEPADTNVDTCKCQNGYIMSEVGGKCIKIEDCPANKGCNGDIHARVKQSPLPCPSTCAEPNVIPCDKTCEPIGCECKPGYILFKDKGKCILPDNCKDGNPCGRNATFVSCKNICPTDYCPVNDDRGTVICETTPFAPCYSGCVCKLNHRILSKEDRRCIVASECPPIKCKRSKEIWNNCPSECRSGYCEDVNKPKVTCDTLLLNCNPRCVCREGYYMNPENDNCVSAATCRKINKLKVISI